MPFVELRHDDLTAGDVDESPARKTQERHVDQGVALRNIHANDDSNGRKDGKDSQEEEDFLEREAGPCEGTSQRYSRG